MSPIDSPAWDAVGLLDYFPFGGGTGEKAIGTMADDARSTLVEMVTRREPPNRGQRAMLWAFHQIPSMWGAASKVADGFASVDYYVSKDGERDDSHPAYRLIERPHPQFSGYDHRYLHILYRDILGESFHWRDGDDADMLLWPLPPVSVERQVDKKKNTVQWEADIEDFRVKIDDEQIIWDKQPSLLNPYGRGKGIGRVLGDELEIVEYSAAFEKSEMFNRSRPDHIIYLPDANETARDQFKERYRKSFQGVENVGKPLVASGGPDGGLQVKEVSRSMKESKVLELRQHSDELVQQTWGLPPEMIGRMENSNLATAKAAEMIFSRHVVVPRATQYVEMLNHEIMPLIDDSGDARFDFVNPTPEDKEHRLAAIEAAPQAATVNEIRELQGLPPREDGDVYLRETRKVEAVEAGPTADQVQQRGAELEDAFQAKAPDEPEAIDWGDIEGAQLRVVGNWETRQTEADRDEIVRTLTPDYIENETTDAYEGEVRRWTTLASQGLGVEANFELLNPRIREHVQEYGGDRIADINDTTKEQVRGVIDEGIKKGKNPRAMIGDLDSLYMEQIIPDRSEVIARTEMLRASNYGTYQAHKVSGVVTKREWIATPDSRTRTHHRSLNGEVVEINKAFVSPLTGAEAKYPGDFGEPRDDIQCRCTTGAKVPTRQAEAIMEKGFPLRQRLFLTDGDGDEVRAAIWKLFDDELNDSERRFQAAVQTAFRRQREDLLVRARQVFGIDADEGAA